MYGAEQYGAKPIKRKVTKVTYSEQYLNALGEPVCLVEQVKTKYPPENVFVKIYYDFFKTLQNPPTINILFLGEMFARMDYVDKNNMRSTVHLGTRQRREISSAIHLSLKSIDRYVSQLIDAGVLFRTKSRGYYIVNPFFIAKGGWRYVAEFREEFDLADGKWVFREDIEEYEHDPAFFDTDIPEEQEKKEPYAHSNLYEKVQAVIDAQDPYKNGTISKEEENVQAQ